MQKLIDHLTALGNGEKLPSEPTLGLCDEVEDKFGRWEMTVVKSYFHGWEFYTGSCSFPVPHDTMKSTDAYFFSGDLWANDSYGDMRRLLCNFIAEKLTEKELK